MKDTLTICGTDYKVLVSWGVLVRFAEQKGIQDMQGLDVIGKLKPNEITPFIRECILVGERIEGREFNMSADELIDRITPLTVKQFYAILADQLTSSDDEQTEDKTVKKKLFGR